MIRHEIFSELVYPVLKQGYLSNDFISMLWLGKLIRNLYENQKLHAEINYITDYDLYRKCFELEPDSDELRELLLETTFQRLKYCIHEWPAGVLYGANGATLEECQEIKAEVDFAVKIDTNKKYSDFFICFSEKLAQYQQWLVDKNL